jgi:hypothetical protein
MSLLGPSQTSAEPAVIRFRAHAIAKGKFATQLVSSQAGFDGIDTEHLLDN